MAVELEAVLAKEERMADRRFSPMRRHWKPRLRILISVLVLVPLWLVPCAVRQLVFQGEWWWIGVVLSDLLGILVVGFLTNNYRWGAGLYVVCTVFEVGLAAVTHDRTLALWTGDLIPGLVASYFAQQLYINMGD